MVSALGPGSSGPGSSPGRGHCVVFLSKTLNSHSASLHPGVLMSTGELLGKPNKLQGSRNTPSRFMRDKLRPDGPLGSNGGFTLVYLFTDS